MSDSVVVFCTCANDEEASRLAQAVIEQHLAACVTILPPVRSIYRWQGNVETALEVLLLIKSTRSRMAALQERIVELHSYDTPEVIAVPIVEGLEKYLVWLREQV